MMQCTRSATEDVIQVPIKDAVDSLQDSLFKKSGRRWSVTSKVEYYHILPYVKMVLTWFRRETLTDNLGVVGGEKIDENLNKPKRKDVTRKLGTQNNQDDATTNNMNKGTSIYDAGLERLPDKTNCMSSLHDAICRPQSPSVDDLVPSNPTEKRKGVSTPTQVIMSYVKKIHGSPVYNHYEATIPCSVTGRQVYNHYGATIPCTVNESKASESGIKVEDGILATNPCIAEGSGEKVASGNLSDNISDQNRNDDHALITCQSNTKHLSKMQAIISKETALSQAAIKALIRKRDKLSHQQRIIEDEIAQCDKNMQTILRGDEDDFVVKLDSVIECCNDVCLRSAAEDKPYQYSEENCSSQLVTRKRLSEEILCIRNPCQQMDHKNLQLVIALIRYAVEDAAKMVFVICKCNDALLVGRNWTIYVIRIIGYCQSMEFRHQMVGHEFDLHRLEQGYPLIIGRISILHDRGGFQANVILKGLDFEYSSNGEVCHNPREARESAAMKMLGQLWRMAASQP
ncbi:hypothetical protein SDJN02_24061, partial [Cucurbita argyrosperma subsp. argyrosperma]